VRLELLTDVVWRYDLLDEVPPSGAGDGQVYGQGTADFSGRVTGSARWSNFPRLRGGYAFPSCQGSIAVAEGAFVLFSMVGMSSLTDGQGVHVLMFRTEHEPHLWLNQVIAVGEGSIDPDAGVLAMRYYACHVDYLPTLPGPLS
jgi:hypothetical protein